MKLNASGWWLCCIILLLFSIFAEISYARKCTTDEVLRPVACPRTCKKPKGCDGEKEKKCICRGSFLLDEESGKCVQPQECPP